jgi:hypothetical protein
MQLGGRSNSADAAAPATSKFKSICDRHIDPRVIVWPRAATGPQHLENLEEA